MAAASRIGKSRIMHGKEGPKMNARTIGEICAGIGVIFSIVWLVLGIKGVSTLGRIRDALQKETKR
jgi:hypothetical protein